MEKFSYMGIGVLVVGLLAGCGGGGGGGGSSSGGDEPSVSGTPKQGLYTGYVRSEDGSSQLILSLEQDGSGEFVNEAPGTYASGAVQFADGQLTGTIRQFQLGEPIAKGEITGTSTTNSFTGESFRENSDGSLEKDGNFDFTRVPQFADLSAAISKIQGTWTDNRTNSPATTITIGPDGAINGSDSNCSDFTGKATIPDQSVNVYKIQFTATGCRAASGDDRGDFTADQQEGVFNGYGYFAPAHSSSPDQFVMLVDNEKTSRYYKFQH